MTPPPLIVRVSEWRLRRRFNRGRYHERVLSGQLTAKINRESVPQASANQPQGTKSQTVSYWDNLQEVARVHQYVGANGQIIASGLPDPKRLFENGVLYRIRSAPKNRQERYCYALSDLRDRICWYFGAEVD